MNQYNEWKYFKRMEIKIESKRNRKHSGQQRMNSWPNAL